MATSPKLNGGLTLIEVLVVMGILIFILSLGLFVSFDAYRGYIFRSERSVAVSVLEKARSRAVNNLYEMPHGVCYDDASRAYVIFRGASCILGAANNETIPGSASVGVSGLAVLSPVVFEQITGKLVPQLSPYTSELDITLTRDAKTASIYINNEGRINW